ncbi:hypothetical protein F1737_03985 [Methanoplanus sp. FWC-SCC4]|uniref:Uncharacterized protein n=1 Tax=Methanochimaera problematica TaxID=2609417 RepID=A0AA97I3W6_9EURY|nr:hypothetical protein [Methanoplanus sp. FWC-SCC4]WOF15914.1 hypothetical protein F1737_03985 [Methanoplanus sp. FWC-SCC4]
MNDYIQKGISLLEQLIDYALILPQKALSGDLFAIMICLISVYILAVSIKKFTKYIILGLKKLIVLIIITIALFIFVQDFLFRILTDGFTVDTLIFGFAGFVCGIVGLIIAISTVVRAVKKYREHKDKIEKHPVLSDEKILQVKEYSETEQYVQIPYMPDKLSRFAKDNSIGMVLIYLIIAEFGIFSSKTIPAVNALTGLSFFLIFIIFAVIFIKLTYVNYFTGLKHLLFALILGFILSILLGYFWGGIPLKILLSIQYFATDALVALITGLSLSLFMSSKGK